MLDSFTYSLEKALALLFYLTSDSLKEDNAKY